MNWHIRPWTDADYAGAVAAVNSCYTEYQDTVDDWKHGDAHRDPKCQHERFVAEQAGEIVGYGNYDQSTGMYHPQRFRIFAAVRPERQGQGIGKALFGQITAALHKYDPIALRTDAREDMRRSVRFLADRGFAEDMKSWESRLAVGSFDFAPFAAAEAKPHDHGIRFTTYAELAHDPDRDRKLYELDVTLAEDVPHPEPMTPWSYEWYVQNIFNAPNLLPDGWFVAVQGDRYVGMSQLWRSQADASELYTGLTGVRREHRRQGIALALKLRAIRYAREHGVQTLKTWNESNNRPMLSINEALGFEKQPIWISFVKTIKAE